MPVTDTMLGVFGGTFDPVHWGHLHSVREVGLGLGLRQIRVVLCGVPGHRAPPAAPAGDRYAMLERALQADPVLVPDGRELSGLPCRTVESLRSLRREHPDQTLCLIVGSDSFLSMPSWHRWQEIFELAHVVVMVRPGTAALDTAAPELWRLGQRCAPEDLRGRAAGCICPFPVTPWDISSTAVRGRLLRGEPAHSLLPSAVASYIKERGLYGSAPSLATGRSIT